MSTRILCLCPKYAIMSSGRLSFTHYCIPESLDRLLVSRYTNSGGVRRQTIGHHVSVPAFVYQFHSHTRSDEVEIEEEQEEPQVFENLDRPSRQAKLKPLSSTPTASSPPVAVEAQPTLRHKRPLARSPHVNSSPPTTAPSFPSPTRKRARIATPASEKLGPGMNPCHPCWKDQFLK